MTVSVQNPLNTQVGTGTAKTFNFSFLVPSSQDLKVFLNGAPASGYTVSGSGNPSGGSITFTTAPGAGVEVRMQRFITLDRSTDFQEASSVPTATLDNDLDRLWLAHQDARVNTLSLTTSGLYDAGSHRIVNVADPVDAQDVVTKNWIDTALTSPLGEAAASATSAAASAATANTYATSASGSATTATGAATLALSRAAAASISETNAANSSTSAGNSASAAATSVATVTGLIGAAQGHAQAAGLSATEAQASETNAALSETNAAASAAAALLHKNSASTSATNAATQAQIALDAVESMGDVAADLELIDEAVTASAASASAAAGSATTASGHASNANTYATAAGNSATAASGSAGTATTKAAEASTSATNASNSATAAAGSATAAGVSYGNCLVIQSDIEALLEGLEGGGGGGDVLSVNGMTGAVVITKGTISLGNVDNTSDASKPISTATQTSLDQKAPLANPSFTGEVSGVSKAMVGLANVDNTSDANKPVSTAQAASIATKEGSIVLGTTSQYFRGDKSWQNLDKTAVGLANVDNTSDANKPVSTAQAASIATKANIASPTFSGTVSGITKAMVGLSNVDNTTDAAKPVSTATTTALNLKANLAGGTAFTGAVTISSAGSLTVTSKAVTVPSTATYGTTTTINAALSNVFRVALTGNITTLTISNPTDGQTISIRFAQDATGGRTVAIPSTVKAAGAIETGASRVSVLTLTYVTSATRWEGGWNVVPV